MTDTRFEAGRAAFEASGGRFAMLIERGREPRRVWVESFDSIKRTANVRVDLALGFRDPQQTVSIDLIDWARFPRRD